MLLNGEFGLTFYAYYVSNDKWLFLLNRFREIPMIHVIYGLL